jgi:SAM-dependent methyltransferase
MPSREVAVNYPKGDITLAYCAGCGFVSNTAFDPSMHEYSTQYEETQGFSPTFRAFHNRLALSLIERFDLRHKKVVEIGCGKGEFLTLLCQLGENSGIGFDPAFVEERNPADGKLDIKFIQDFYSETYADVTADFFCCKMTLEHIPDPAHFVRTVRRAVGASRNAIVFFQVPDALRVFNDLAFWDIYYEHCSYFSPGSLTRVFREAGFEVLETWTDYDDQYLMITAKPCPDIRPESDIERRAPAVVEAAIEVFCGDHFTRLGHWRDEVCRMRSEGQRAVVWGSGSKGVAFLTSLQVDSAIEYVVDINPYRQGKFMAGTGQEIVPPEFLTNYKPDIAIVMNPVYKSEVQETLHSLGLSTTVLSV